MKRAYRILAYLIALGVMVQAAVVVLAVDGLGKWVEGGGVLNKAVVDSESLPFDEAVGFTIHAVTGLLIIPLLALGLMVLSFFVKTPGAVRWAGAVLALVILQGALGLAGHTTPLLGGLHGLNALILFSTAVYAAQHSRTAPAPGDLGEHLAAPA